MDHFRFIGDLSIIEIEGTDFWVIRDPYALFWEEGGKHCHIDLPAYYVTDMASVPFFARKLIHPLDDDIRKIAPAHDRAYETHTYWCDGVERPLSQARADALLYYGMRARGAPYRRAWAAYLAVRTCGGGAYADGPARRTERQSLAKKYQEGGPSHA